MNFENEATPKAAPIVARMPLIDSVMGRKMFPLPRFVAVKTPYIKEIYSMLDDKSLQKEVVVMKGAALGFTCSPFYFDGISLSFSQWIVEAENNINATI